jgi:hypothetical protein
MKVPTNSHLKHAKGRKKPLRPGQPAHGSKLDLKLTREFCEHVKEGLSFETVCGLCRVSRATFYQWMQRGRAEPGTAYAEFVAVVDDLPLCFSLRCVTLDTILGSIESTVNRW